MPNYLGIDYGDKYLGLAWSAGLLTEPIKTILTASAAKIIPPIILEHHIQKIIIGLSEGQMAIKTHQFGANLHKTTGIPIIYHDETLSSYETRQKMAQAGQKKSKREQKIDHLVAAAILQDYLDSHPNN